MIIKKYNSNWTVWDDREDEASQWHNIDVTPDYMQDIEDACTEAEITADILNLSKEELQELQEELIFLVEWR